MHRRNYHAAPQPEPEDLHPKAPPMTLTVSELCREMNISRATAYELVKQEDFPSFTIRRRILINRQRLQEWMDRQ